MRIEIKEKSFFNSIFTDYFKISKDTTIQGITNDSRLVQENDLFIALNGKFVNGNAFNQEVLSKKNTLIVSEEAFEDGRIYNVESIDNFLKDLCKYWINKTKAFKIAVTGSNGKTTTKELIHHLLLKNNFTAEKTEGNYNTSIGVPLSLFSFSLESDYYIFEFGANQKGDIEKLTKMITPDFGLVTSIAEAHMEGFLDIENIKNEKKKIIEFSKKGSFGPDKSIESVLLKVKKILKDSLYSSNHHLIYNMALVVSILNEVLIIDEKKLLNGLKDFSLPPGRGNIFELIFNGKKIFVIDDSYNANPSSVRAAIENLHLLKIKKINKKIFIFGDMKELGKNKKDFHSSIGKLIDNKINCFFSIGNLAKETFDSAIMVPNKYHFDNQLDLYLELTKIIESNDVLLFKVSRSMNLNRIIEKLISESK